MNFAHFTLKNSLKVKSNDTVGKSNPDFLFTVNSKQDFNCNILRVISILKCRNYEFANFTLKNSLKVKSNDTIRKNKPNFLFTANSNWDPISNILRVRSVLKCRNYEFCLFDLDKSLKVKSNDTIGKNNPGFLFIANSN